MAKTSLSVTLHMSELLYDVQNKTFLTGRSRDNGQNFAEVAHMQASGDDEDNNQILRSIGNAFNALKTDLSEYLDETKTSTSNVLISESENLTLAFKMPSNYNQAATDSISASLHSYIVNKAVAEWFNITNKADASDYLALAAENLEQAKKAVSKRVRPTHTKVTTT
jgi:hypothetical protein